MDFSSFTLQGYAISGIVSIFILGMFGIRSKSNFLASLSSNSETLLTSLGIFFTFLGIYIALRNFDTFDIQNSIPTLLGGLKLAFLSSVVGLGGAISFKIVRPLLEPESNNYGDVTAANLLEELTKINATTGSVKDSISGEGDSSLSTQIIKMRNDFRDFAEKVSEDGSNALIKALEEVIKDFNAKISEQFGENFSQLNEAVGNLLEWQKEYRSQVELMIQSFNETKEGIHDIRVSLNEIQQSTSKIPVQMGELETVFQNTDTRMIELHEGLSSLSKMREQAVSSLPIIEENLNRMTSDLKESVEKQLEIFNDNIKRSGDVYGSQIEQFQGVLDSLNIGADNMLDSTKKVSSEVENIISNFNSEQIEYTKRLNSSLESSAASIEEIMNKSFSELDKGMQDELQRSLNVMGSNLTAVTKAFVEQYEPFAMRISKIMEGSGKSDV